jgi:5-methylphenazine-1-carboxylate 1-monooxygenase
LRAIIVGGGIAGLTTALALHRIGMQSTVLEVAPALRPVGVGINLLPHSMRVLADLDLQDSVLAAGIATRELVYFNRLGQRIWGEARGRFAGYPWPQVSLPRAELYRVLLESARQRLGDEALVSNRRLIRFTQSAGAVTAWCMDSAGVNHQVDGDLLLGCDGIHSAVRGQIHAKEGPPVYGGRILWRGVSLAKPFLTGASMMMAGHQDQKFVCYPISPPNEGGLQRLNWIAELARPTMPNREDWNRGASISEFLPQFESWIFDWLDVPELIRSAEAVFEYPLVDRDPLRRWTDGRMTLVGDAAHPMYPIGSNGASQAILDAGLLSQFLATAPSVDEALASYDAARRPATTAIVLANRGNGPEQCMQLAHERAPNGFDNIEGVVPATELEAIAARYKQVAGFSRETLAQPGYNRAT